MCGDEPQSILYADGQMKKLSAATFNKSYILTEETVKMSTELSQNVVDSIILTLQDDKIYYQHPNTLARDLVDLWNGERYRAVRFAMTFTADVVTATTVHRYRQYGVEYMEFDAELDDRTTDQCRALHGTIFDMSKGDVDRYRPPLHHHCRSGLKPVPITREVDDDMLFEKRDFSGDDKVFDDIAKFNEKYRIDKFVLDQDISARIISEKGLQLPIPTRLVDSLEEAAKQAIIDFRKELNAREIDVINAYTDKENGKASMWNQLLLEGKPIPLEDVEAVRQLSDILQRAPKFTGTTYRGLRFDNTNARDTFVSGLVIGKHHKFPSFSSSSVHVTTAEKFASENGVIIKFISQKGVYLNGLSAAPEESEVLFDRGFVFRVVAKNVVEKFVIIEIIDP